MRIGIDLTALWRSATGMENVAIEMTRALLRRDLENRYVLFFGGSVHPKLEEFAGQFEAILAPRWHDAQLKVAWFPRAMAAAKLDYLHFPVFPPPWNCPCPSGWTAHDASPWLFPETMKFKSRWYFKILGKRAAKIGRVLITYTEAARRDLSECLRVRPESIHVIPPGVRSVFRQSRNPEARRSLRDFYRLPERFVLFVGTLEPRKNLPRILQAFRILRSQYHFEPALVIVGRKGWRLDGLFAELKKHELAQSVYLTGYVPDEHLVALYELASLLIFPSLYEGFGLPCIEAMACGCPVVTSDRGALYEVTRGCAMHSDPEDVAAIARAIWQVNADEPLREQLVANGLRHVATFSWDRSADQFFKILTRAVRGDQAHHPQDVDRRPRSETPSQMSLLP